MPDRRAGMHEAADFEARFATALLRYAEQVPTEVDAGALSQEIARAHPRRPDVLGFRAGRLIPVPPLVRRLLFLVVIALLLASLMLASLMTVGQRQLDLRSFRLAMVHANCTVADPGWTVETPSAKLTEDQQVSCRATSSDTRFSGLLTLTFEEFQPMSGGPSPTALGPATTTADAVLAGQEHAWHGHLTGHRGPNGLEAADLDLTADDLDLEVTFRMISADGLEWSAVGQVRTLSQG